MVKEITGLRKRHYKTIASDPETFVGDRVPEGERWWVETTSVFNDVTDNAECLVGIKSGMIEYPIYLFENITVDLWSKKFLRLWLFPGESLYYKWSGVTAADPVEMTCHGHRKYIE